MTPNGASTVNAQLGVVERKAISSNSLQSASIPGVGYAAVVAGPKYTVGEGSLFSRPSEPFVPEPLVSYRDPRRQARPANRERQISLRRPTELLDSSRIHPNKAMLREIERVPKPECDEIHQERFADWDQRIRNIVKKYCDSKTGWELLQQEWKAIEVQPTDGKNTDYRNTKIDLNDLRLWDNFPTVDDIRMFSESTPLLWKNFHKSQLPVVAGDQQWYDRWFGGEKAPPARSETRVVEVQGPFFDQLNALIRLASDNGGNSSCVMIGEGRLAMKRRYGGTPRRKCPDRVACWTYGKYPRVNSQERDETPHVATEVPCLLVGDYKRAGKFDQQILVDACKLGEAKAEPQKVVNQIHDYMDMHNNRFGYIVTEIALVTFRRREEGETKQRWGQLDFSPSVPIHTPEGQLNALMVLWYFHVKYAVMNEDEGWELPSFYHNCPLELGGGRYPDEEDGGVAQKGSSVVKDVTKSPSKTKKSNPPSKKKKEIQ
jgi:hypothetical protein